jgi:NADP-dependent 3-hydroxy acid dehydrogenase YdfG
MGQQHFRDQIAIVTGASSGIGRATALALAEQGAQVALAARRLDILQEIAQEIRAMGSDGIAVQTDVSQREQVDDLIQETLRVWGKIDILVANAGQYIRASLMQMPIQQIELSLKVNFWGGIYPVFAALPHMLEQRSGHIVLVSSMIAKKSIPPDAPYAAAKWALAGFADVLRQELYGTGVKSMIAFPGRVDTVMIQTLKVPAISAKISTETVAKAILAGMRHNKAELIVPNYNRSLFYLQVLSPRLADYAVRFFHLQGWEQK